MLVRKCDICGAEILGSETYSKLSIATIGSEDKALAYEVLKDIDICDECVRTGALQARIKHEFRKAPEHKQTPAAEEPKPRKKRIPFDIGKALALRKAGWTLEKIADELRCSPQTVANNINRVTTKEETTT